MPDYYRFDTNVPIELEFTHTDGKEVEGRFGLQYFRGTTDGRGVYLQPIVEQRLLGLEVQPGQRVSICKAEVKTGRKRGIEWQVKLVDPAPTAAVTPVRQQTQERPRNVETQERPTMEPIRITGAQPAKTQAPVTEPEARRKPVESATTNTTPPEPADRPITHTQLGNLLRSCLCVAIDSARDAQQYANANGYPLTFSADQVQALAVTIFIDQSKKSNIMLMRQADDQRRVDRVSAQANGGTSWPH